MENITLEKCHELIEFIDLEMRAFDAIQSEDYDYERDLFISSLSLKVKDFLNLKELSFSDLQDGMIVQDDFGNIGHVLACDDIHGVYVEFENKEKRLFCLDLNCIDRDGGRLFSK